MVIQKHLTEVSVALLEHVNMIYLKTIFKKEHSDYVKKCCLLDLSDIWKKYGFGNFNERNNPHATQLLTVIPDQFKDIPTKHTNAEKYLVNFSHLTALIKFQNRNLKLMAFQEKLFNSEIGQFFQSTVKSITSKIHKV